ncbi:MAG: hypothetical protein J3R72DRAFT_417605 [Linnemannia gamsii]|nr:MAG: hypothetical protein J3R72DRAFT_417605 [Linnemannia gamsii]
MQLLLPSLATALAPRFRRRPDRGKDMVANASIEGDQRSDDIDHCGYCNCLLPAFDGVRTGRDRLCSVECYATRSHYHINRRYCSEDCWNVGKARTRAKYEKAHDRRLRGLHCFLCRKKIQQQHQNQGGEGDKDGGDDEELINIVREEDVTNDELDADEEEMLAMHVDNDYQNDNYKVMIKVEGVVLDNGGDGADEGSLKR